MVRLFARELQNYAFICVQTTKLCFFLRANYVLAFEFELVCRNHYQIRLLGFFSLRVDPAVPEQTRGSRPIKKHLLRISFYTGPFVGSDSAAARAGPQSRFSANCKRVLRVGVLRGLLEMLLKRNSFVETLR